MEQNFRLQIIKDNQKGNSVISLSKKWNISTSLIRKWIDHHSSLGSKRIVAKARFIITQQEFKLNVVKAYNDKQIIFT